MTSLVDQPRWRRIGALVLAVTLAAGACSDDGGSDGAVTQDAGPNTLPPQTLPGGVELAAVDPLRLLAGDGLAYGQPLPSEQAAAEAYLEDPEVASVMARQLHSRGDGRRMGDVLVLELNGAEIFDESVLDGFVGGAVGALGDGTTEPVTIAGRPVLRSQGPSGTVMGYREGNQLMLVRGPAPEDIGGVVERQLQALAVARSARRSRSPRSSRCRSTPPSCRCPPCPSNRSRRPRRSPRRSRQVCRAQRGFWVATAWSPGERRTNVWAHTLDPTTYPSAERLEPALAALASTPGRCARGGEGGARPPRLQRRRRRWPPLSPRVPPSGLALVVEGQVPAQLDAVITAWLTELA